MTKVSAHFSISAPVFNKTHLPENGSVVGYAALIHSLGLKMPIPQPCSLVSEKNKRYETEAYKVFPKSYNVEDNNQLTAIEALFKHLVFALKYEGVNLLFFKKLAEHYSVEALEQLVSIEPTGQYTRRIWFLLEWVMQKELPNIKGLTKKSYVKAIDTKLQYAIEGEKSPRHLVINNLPGTVNFCPLIKKTEKIEAYINAKLNEQKSTLLNTIHGDVLQRASAFLLLKDSKASFTIEGEQPRNNRAARWGQAIGQAGGDELNENELIRLQELVIENKRFIQIGLRNQHGFIGDRDRTTQEPIPEHISAKHEDLKVLMEGWYQTKDRLLNSEMDPVLVATTLAFGFVFIHPLVDGNGRLHRYIIHHILAKMEYTQQGMIFPVSASILSHINDYQKALSSYSSSILEFIDWKTAADKNVAVLNDTQDYYSYFDATEQTKFLYACVEDTIKHVIPYEVKFLQQFDAFKQYMDEYLEMPDNMVSLLIGFLQKNNGKLSQRAQEKEFAQLTSQEVANVEAKFQALFIQD